MRRGETNVVFYSRLFVSIRSNVTTIYRVHMFWERNGAGLAWRGCREPMVRSAYGTRKLEHGTQTTIEVMFADASWKFAGRHPPKSGFGQRYVIGHLQVSDAEQLTVCSEVTITEGVRTRLWIVDSADQPLVEIGGSHVPAYDRECGTWIYATAKSVTGNVLWVSTIGFREGLRSLFQAGTPYAYAKSESLFDDRLLVAGVLLYEKLVDPMADFSGDLSG